jgi:hypothetical protein
MLKLTLCFKRLTVVMVVDQQLILKNAWGKILFCLKYWTLQVNFERNCSQNTPFSFFQILGIVVLLLGLTYSNWQMCNGKCYYFGKNKMSFVDQKSYCNGIIKGVSRQADFGTSDSQTITSVLSACHLTTIDQEPYWINMISEYVWTVIYWIIVFRFIEKYVFLFWHHVFKFRNNTNAWNKSFFINICLKYTLGESKCDNCRLLWSPDLSDYSLYRKRCSSKWWCAMLVNDVWSLRDNKHNIVPADKLQYRTNINKQYVYVF